ncbi:MAG: OadG family protein [Clostridia bacterium]|nr:OadG family protein [Clostridia bacterium]
MWMNLLIDTLPEGGVQATFLEAVLYALMGYLVVFAGIAFLILVVWLVGKLMTKTGGVKLRKGKKTVVENTPSPVAEVLPEQSEEVDEETVAVIMAALTAYYEKKDPKCEFTIKRIKKVRRNNYA